MCKCIRTCSDTFKYNCYRCKSLGGWQLGCPGSAESLELRCARFAGLTEPALAGSVRNTSNTSNDRPGAGLLAVKTSQTVCLQLRF